MQKTIQEIIAPLNLSDSWCATKIERLNDIFTNFAIEMQDCPLLRVSEKFNWTECETRIQTRYPITKIYWFYVDKCTGGCTLDTNDCCWNYKRLLVERGNGSGLPNNHYSFEPENVVNLNTTSSIWEGLLIYNRGFKTFYSMKDTIEIDKYTLSLLRLYIKTEYALEWDNDVSTYSYYENKFTKRLEKVKAMLGNQLMFIQPWGVQIKAQR